MHVYVMQNNTRVMLHIILIHHPVGWEGQKSDFISAVFDAGGILGESIHMSYTYCLN